MSAEDTTTIVPPRNGVSRRFITVLFAVLVGVGAVIGGGYYINSLPYEKTDDAFIEGDVIAISPQVSGQVLKVLVETNQKVDAGDLLVIIDPEYYEERVAHQNASIELVQARKRTAKTNV